MRTGAKAVEPIVSRNGKIPSHADRKDKVGIPPSSCSTISEKLNTNVKLALQALHEQLTFDLQKILKRK